MSHSASCQEENFSLQVVKTSLLNEETRRKDMRALSQSESNVAQNLSKGRDKDRSPTLGQSLEEDSRVSIMGNEVIFKSLNCKHLTRDKSKVDSAERKKIADEKNTSAVATSEEEMLFICKQASVKVENVECFWVVDSGASFHLTPKRECFSSYTVGDYGYVKMGNDGACKIVGIGNVCLLT